MIRSRLLWKLYAGYVVLIVLTTGVTAVLVSARLVRDSREQIRESLEVRAVLLGELAAPSLDRRADAALLERVRELGRRTATRYTVIRADGIVLADSDQDPALMDNHATRPEVLEARTRGVGIATRFSDTVRRTMMYVALRVDAGSGLNGYVRASLPLTTINEQLAHLRGLVIIVAVLTGAAALLIGFFIARRFTAPLASMTALAGDFASGDYRGRMEHRSPDEMGQLAAAFNAMADELRLRMDTITRERNQLLAILGGLVEGVIAVDRHEHVVHMNEVAGRILSVPHRTSLGRSVWELTRVREVTELIRRCMGQEVDAAGIAVIPGEKHERAVEVVASRLVDDRGEVAGAVVVLHDVTELRRLEAIRRDFVANASHELKTPITAVRGLVETMIEDPDMDAETRVRFLGRIRDQSARLSAVVSDLLTISRLESRPPRAEHPSLDLRGVVGDSHRALQALAEEKGLTLEVALPAEALYVRASREELRQVVDNLLDNAIKYTPDGGRVTVRVERQGDLASLSVQDTGIGFEPAHRERIFERFYRVDQARSRELGGTGLGLSIVKNIVQGLGGRLRVESTPGVGSTFEVTIPAGPAVRPPVDSDLA